MALITLLTALFLERILGSLEDLRRYDRFQASADRLFARSPGEAATRAVTSLALLLLPPVVTVAALQYGLRLVWPPFEILLGVIVLLHTFGRRDLEAEVEAYLDAWQRGDEESAGWYAGEFLGGIPPEDGRDLTRALMEQILVEVHERLLAVIFWFLVLGPAGAVLYRLIALLHQQAEGRAHPAAELAGHLHTLFAWLPVRLAALSFALSGSFVDAIAAWRDYANRWFDHNRGVLVASGFGALRINPLPPPQPAPLSWPEENQKVADTLSLARRTVWLALALLALLTLGGWTS